MEIGTVGVVGLGTMGAGIAEVCARHGHRVIAIEPEDDSLERGRGSIDGSTQRAVKRGKLTEEERAEILGRITFSTNLEELAGADLVVEAIPEDLDAKRDLFGRLDKITPPHAILATNTSSLSVTDIAVATSRPARVAGLHFFNPAPVQAFVEVVTTVVTDPDVVEDLEALARSLGKEPVVIGDRAGFIANALLFGYLNQAVTMYEANYASREDIDAAMRLGCGYPMGPLALLDLIGLDTAYQILDTIYRESRDRLYAPAPILKQMVTAGLRGRKTGRGFYTYAAPNSPEVIDDAAVEEAAIGAAPRPVRSVGVVGSGTMATGIAEVMAKGGFAVTLVARSESSLTRALGTLDKSLEKAVQRGKLEAADRDAIRARITGASSLEALADVDLAIEAVVEEISVKTALFENLDEICKPGAVLATTTSSLPVIDLAAATSRPQDVVGLHFFNPAPLMKLVEVVRTVSTAPDVLATAVDVTQRAGRHPVVCGDRAGFIVNALLFPYLNDAVKMLEANYASADAIDLAMKKGCGYPMGPFELLDVVGLDVSLAIQQTLYREFREPGFSPAPRLEHLVTAGYLGRKTGRGFRAYA
ncbi:MAG: 3-hydroxyacyl-CoA dehydrogenase family protein [Candidatus Nanopelagicales bacterium]|jgi:3-hydroxybutyryl-CoA dehydrogenase